MALSTDSVLLGSWVNCSIGPKLLDAGTGTGIIALMVAQRFTKTSITAIDFCENAANLADYNIRSSPWNDRIRVIREDFMLHRVANYDHIVSNPPFFENSLHAHSEVKRNAKHVRVFSPIAVIKMAAILLNNRGKVSLIAEAKSEEQLLTAAKEEKLIPLRICRVSSKSGSDPFRVLLELGHHLGFSVELPIESAFPIRNRDGSYSGEYSKLTADFYLPTGK